MSMRVKVPAAPLISDRRWPRARRHDFYIDDKWRMACRHCQRTTILPVWKLHRMTVMLALCDSPHAPKIGFFFWLFDSVNCAPNPSRRRWP